MPSLHDLQQRFASALSSDDPTAAPGFAVYRQAIDANYRRALGATFPVVRALVGAAFFDAAVDAFVAAHPPASGDLNVYGAEFADFLAGYEPASTLPYLPDVARLEWALDESSRAADREANPQALIAAIGAVDEDAVPQMRLALHPSCRLLASRYAVFEIWKVHQPGQADDARLEIAGPPAEYLLTRRTAQGPVVERIGAAEFLWLEALRSGETFGAALARAMDQDANFDLAEVLQARVMDGTLSDLRFD